MPRLGRRLCDCQLAPKRLRLHVVRADPLAVDLDHRDQLTVARLELSVAVDRNLDELEAKLLAQPSKLGLGPLAQMTPLRLVESDARPTDKAPG
jgi:hypothetical protein